MIKQRQRWVRFVRGFTLVELLLAVVLVLGMLGAVVYNFSSFQRSARLDEGAVQVEALFRFARAHAASTGRQVRVEFRPQAGLSAQEGQTATEAAASKVGQSQSVRVLWEPDPIEAPGVFQELTEAANFVEGITDSVSVQTVTLDGGAQASGVASKESEDFAEGPESSGVSAMAASNPSASAVVRDPMQPVMFYPDGSGDTVRVVLASRNDDDERRLAVRMVGVTGAIQRWVMPDPSSAEHRPSGSDAAPEASADVPK